MKDEIIDSIDLIDHNQCPNCAATNRKLLGQTAFTGVDGGKAYILQYMECQYCANEWTNEFRLVAKHQDD